MADLSRPAPADCQAGFFAWFWAFPFLLDVRIGGWDVLPDAVGYLFIAFGARRLGRFHKSLPDIERLAFILVGVGVFDEFQPPGASPIEPSLVTWAVLVGAVGALLSAILVWLMAQVVADFGRRLHAGDLVRAAEMRRLLYIGWQVAVLVALALALATDGGSLLILGLFFAGIAVLGLLMELMMSARQLCGGRSRDAMPIPETQPRADAHETQVPVSS